MAKASSSASSSSGDSGATALEEAVKVGYLGVVTDERDNEEYTVEGVTSAPDVTDDAYAQAKADEAKKAADAAVSSIGGTGSGVVVTETEPPAEGEPESPYDEALDQGYEGGPEAASGDEDMTIEGQMELHLRGVVPKSGPTAGGTVLAVDGTGLSRVTAVQVGDADAEFMVVGGGDALNVITPGGEEGSVVSIRVSAGEESTDLSDAFTYTDEDGS